MSTYLCFVLLWFGLGYIAADAQAKDRVLLLNFSPSLERAIEQALEPWDIQAEGVSAAMGDSTDLMHKRAIALSLQYEAMAIVWISDNDSVATLGIYNSQDEQVVVRELAERPPYDEVAAASVALSIKTVLLDNRGAVETKTRTTQPSDKVTTGPGPEVLEKTTTPKTDNWLFVTQIMARHSVADDDSLQSRLVLGAGRQWSSLSFSLLVALGPGRDVKDLSFKGSYRDLAVRLELGYPMSLSEWVVEPLVSGTAHRSQLQGKRGAIRVDEQRFNPSLDLGLRVGRRFSSMEIGVSAIGSGYSRSQRYLVKGEVLLDLPAFELAAGIFARLRLP